MKPIISIDTNRAVGAEHLGTKPKFWYKYNGENWLFKQENRNTGEDWAEVIVADILNAFSIPHAEYLLAETVDRGGTVSRGVATRSIVPPDSDLLLGNSLLVENDQSYPESGDYGVSAHSIEAVSRVISGLQVPSGIASGSGCKLLGSHELFAGYLFVDALVSNQDRHHENWGALVSGTERTLSPTFDHGASLARNLTEKEMSERLQSRDKGYSVRHFSTRARSALYKNDDSAKPLKTIDAFKEYCVLANIDLNLWRLELEKLSKAQISEIVNEIPEQRMSDIAKQFTIALIEANRNRLNEL